MKLITKLSKKYFLYVAKKTIEKSIIIGLAIFMASMTIITLLYGDGWKTTNLCCTSMTICSYLTLILLMLNFIVTRLCITSLKINNKKINVVCIEDHIQNYQKPIWGKYPYWIIKLPKNWKRPLSKRIHSLEIESKVRVNKLVSSLKFQAYFSFDEDLNEKELNTLIKSQVNYQSTHQIDFAECMKSLFVGYNILIGNNELIEIIISDWLDSNRERSDLIEKINGIIAFPNDLFNNMKIEFLLEKVDIQLACVLG